MNNYDEIAKFIFKYQPEGVIVDTEVLILFFLGKYNPDLVEQNKITNKFQLQDIDLVDKIIGQFKKIIITPHIIAEVSNHSKYAFKSPHTAPFFETMVKLLESTTEKGVEINELCKTDIQLISEYGFTDMAMHHLSHDTGIPILSSDGRFCRPFSSQIPIINFNYIKSSESLR